MQLLVTVHAVLYYTEDGSYYANMVYGYDFFKRYLNVFEKIRIVAFTQRINKSETKDMLLLNGEGIEVFPVPYSRNVLSRLKQYFSIKQSLMDAIEGIDAAVLRIPEQLPFQLYDLLKKKHIPTAVEVVVDPWNYFANKNGRTIWQFVRRYTWTAQQKRICKEAIGASYVTSESLQKIYPPRAIRDTAAFTESYTSAEIAKEWYTKPREVFNDNPIKLIHVSTNLDNNGKGYIELLQFFAQVVKKGIAVELTLVGGGNLKSDALNIIKENHLESYIRFTGKISEKQRLRDEYINADFLVFPTYGEGLPRTIIEAMGTGLVCLSTCVNGVVELLERKDLVAVGDSDALVRLFFNYIAEPVKYAEASKRNFKKSLLYSKENVEKTRTSYYQKLRKFVETQIGIG